jgi:hypothetical protein
VPYLPKHIQTANTPCPTLSNSHNLHDPKHFGRSTRFERASGFADPIRVDISEYILYVETNEGERKKKGKRENDDSRFDEDLAQLGIIKLPIRTSLKLTNSPLGDVRSNSLLKFSHSLFIIRQVDL